MALEEDKLKMDQDLERRLDHLYGMLMQPSFHLAKTFDEIRSYVDYDAERIQINEDDSAVYSNIQDARLEFIRILNAIEERLRSRLSNKPPGTNEAYESLEKRVNEFMETPCVPERLNDLEDEYVQLALELIEQTNAQEKEIFDNQTVLYRSSGDQSKLGNLVHVGDVCLTREEISVMRAMT